MAMMRAIAQEFATIDLIRQLSAITKEVDALCLTWIKFECQLRRLTANILYRATAIPADDQLAKEALRAALFRKDHIKHDHFMGGIRKLAGCSVKDVMGAKCKELRRAAEQAYDTAKDCALLLRRASARGVA
jgi:hypothetical protein